MVGTLMDLVVVAVIFRTFASAADVSAGWRKGDENETHGPVDDVTQCLTVGQVCIKESYLSVSKVKCVYDMVKCLGKATICGYECVDKLNTCWVDKIWAGMKGPDCTQEFKTCLSSWCMMEKCKAEQYTCLSHAESYWDKMECYYGLKKCLTLKYTKCALKCVPEIVACTIRNMFYPIKFAKCYVTYVQCAIESCKKEFEGRKDIQ